MKDSRISCRIVVLNYNGKDLLQRFLPSLIKSANTSRFPCKVTVLDNRSSDDSVAYIQEHFPEVSIIISAENKVLCSYNDAVRQMDEDIVILINNDMGTTGAEETFVDPLLEVFLEKPDAFFVATHGDCSIASERWGIIGADITYPVVDAVVENPGYAFSAGGAAFDRKKFIELGGYDEIYLPGLYEDVDLCYRAWKMGWKGYYQPASKKSHIGSASMSKRFTQRQLQALAFRNGILFMAKNISDPILLIQFVFLLGVRLVGAVCLNRWFFIQGFTESLQKLPQALKSRKDSIKKVTCSDRELLRIINNGRKQKTHIRLMKWGINWLGSAPDYLRKPALGVAFLTIRLFFPLQFLLLRDLINCNSVLDLGCGNHSMVPSMVPEHVYTVGVEYFKPYYEESVQKGRHKKCIHSNVMEVEFEDKSFDAVVLSDVLEHLTKEEGQILLQRMERWARKKVIVFTPNGFVPQEEYDSNPFMEHKSGWDVNEFKKTGYRVFGVRGFKFLKNLYLDENKKPGLPAHLGNLTQLFTYHVPNTAFQLFCRKDLSYVDGPIENIGKLSTTVSIVLIVYNEEKNIERCLNSVKWADEIIVVDSNSTDRTIQICRKYTDKIFSRTFSNYSDQKNFAVSQTTGEWVLSIDADEELTNALTYEIKTVLQSNPRCDGYRIHRSSSIFGRTFRFSGTQHDKPIRLFRKGKGEFSQPIHEFVSIRGPVCTLKADMNHHTYENISSYLSRLDQYTTREAEFLLAKGVRVSTFDWFARPVGMFLKRYIIHLGFRDGFEGFIFSFFSAVYVLVKYSKHRELLRGRKFRESLSVSEKAKKDVWIVVLNWNGPDDTVECVESCLKIKYEPFHIVIVDNHSTDNSVEIFQRNFPTVPLIITEENLGYAGGNNVGIKYALKQSADYVLLLNNDVVVEPDVLSELIEGMHAYPAATMAAPKVMYYDTRNVVSSMGTSMDWFKLRPYLSECNQVDHGQYVNVVKKNILVGCALMVRSDMLNEVGLIDENFFMLHEEADWCLRNLRFGYENIVVPKGVVYHKGSKTTRTIPNFSEVSHYYSIRNFLYMCHKNATWFDRWKVRTGFFLLSIKNMLKLIVGNEQERKLAHVFFDASYDYFQRSMGKCTRAY